MFFLDTKVVHLHRMAYSWKLLIHWVFYLFLQDCQFIKTKDDTALLVVYQGNLYLGGCNNCYKRWFITFNSAESAVVPCLLTRCCGSQILVKTTTDPGSLRATVTTYTRAKSELESTLETVQDMETPMVTQAGIQCPVWSLKKFLAPSNKLKPWLS